MKPPEVTSLPPTAGLHSSSTVTNTFLMWRASADGSTFCYWGRENAVFAEPVVQEGRQWLRTVHDEDRALVQSLWLNALRTRLPFQTTYRQMLPDGGFRWFQDQALPMLDAEGRVREWVGVVTDIHDDVEARASLQLARDRLQVAVDGAEIGLWEVDLKTGSSWLSEPAARLLGLGSEGVYARETIVDAIDETHRDDVLRKIGDHVRGRSQDRIALEFPLRGRADASSSWVSNVSVAFYGDDGKPVRVIGVLRDITERRRQQDELVRLAYTDVTTGLPNRRAFLERAEAMISANDVVTMLLLDLDDFKRVNNILGPIVGDELLRGLSARLLNGLPDGGYLARVGGDEFAILLPGVGDELIAKDIAIVVQSALSCPINATGRLVSLTATIGLAIVTPSVGVSELMARASVALQEAKACAPGTTRFFAPALQQKRERETSLYEELSRAVSSEQFELFYQPQVRLSDQRIVGAEALIRWRHPERGLLAPFHFIQELAKSRWAPAVGRWVIERACADAVDLRSAGMPLRMAVNVFPVQFQMQNFERTVLDTLLRYEIEPSLFEIEVTEEVVLGNDDMLIATLKRLRDVGCGIAFDDYGTGYASLSMLKRYPISRLKIDRSFVSGICSGVEDLAIVDAVLALGRTFHLNIVAEGIETPDQAELLRLRGCQEGQGYLFGKPMPLAGLKHCLRPVGRAVA